MSIECTFKTNTKSITLDLENYIGNYKAFTDALHREFEIDIPVIVNMTFEVVDSDYFNSMEDVELFLGINFAYGYLPNIFLAWVYHTGNDFSAMNLFNEKFMGQFQEPKDFCKEYIEKETTLNTMPTCVRNCVDYEKMWDKHLSDHFYALKVEDANFSNISMYVYAIFK